MLVGDSDRTRAKRAAERVRQAIEAVGSGGIAPRLDGPAISASIGVAAYPADGTTASDLVLAADRACFASKRGGRGLIATAAEGLAMLADFARKDPTPVDTPTPVSTATLAAAESTAN
jgi:predicted signal transduction protein with EAL and GGDEF domain